MARKKREKNAADKAPLAADPAADTDLPSSGAENAAAAAATTTTTPAAAATTTTKPAPAPAEVDAVKPASTNPPVLPPPASPFCFPKLFCNCFQKLLPNCFYNCFSNFLGRE